MSGAAISAPGRKRYGKTWWFSWLAIGLVGGFTFSIFQPPVYRANTTVLITPQRVPARFVEPVVTADAGERLTAMQQVISSRTRLERIIQEFNLYERERRTMIMEDVVEQMRSNMNIDIARPRDDKHETRSFSVSFQSPDPRQAMRVTERLASLLVEENLEERQLLVDQTDQFLTLQIEDLDRKLMASDRAMLDAKRRGVTLSDLSAQHDVLVEEYKELLRHREASKRALDVERQQIGEQFKIIDGARLPERPIGPRRLPHVGLGALAGLATGALWAIAARSWRRRQAWRHPLPPSAAVS